MNTLAVDPGEQTGILKFNLSEYFVDYCVTLPIESAVKVISETDFKHLIMEKRPMFHDWPDDLNNGYEEICKHAESTGTLHLITPGIWKPIAKSMGWKAEFANTPHERDVCNIFKYWFMITYGREMEEMILKGAK